ncbi:UNVERIFIED_ORG: hypothetical protein C0V67_01030 [Anaplasma ovis]
MGSYYKYRVPNNEFLAIVCTINNGFAEPWLRDSWDPHILSVRHDMWFLSVGLWGKFCIHAKTLRHTRIAAIMAGLLCRRRSAFGL